MARAVTQGIEEQLLAAGTSKRFAARLGALARKQLFISDVVLELLEEGEAAKPLQHFLFTPALLEQADALSAEGFAQLFQLNAKDAFFDINPLHLIVGGSARLIALTDEAPGVQLDHDGSSVSAQHAHGTDQDASSAPPAQPYAPASRQGSAPDSEQSSAQSSGGAGDSVDYADTPQSEIRALIERARTEGQSPVLSQQESDALFSGDQVAEVKLVLLTSTNPDAKVEALRQLWLSPIDPDAKARLFITALRDESQRVRGEAAKGLGSLGMDARATENLARASSGELDERLVSLSNLEHLFSTLEEREQALIVSVLIGMIQRREEPRVLGEVLSLLTTTLPAFLASSPTLMQDVHARLQELLLVKRADLLPAARKLYRAMMAAAPESLASLLQSALAEVAPVYLRSFYLSLIAISGTAVAEDERTVELLLDALIETDEFDPSYLTLNTSLQELGTRTLPVVLRIVHTTTESRQARLLGILADLTRTHDLSSQERDQIASALLDLFDASESEVRNQIYECGVLRTRDFSPELRARATKLMLDDLHEHELESGREMVASSILQFGGPSFPVVLERVFTATHDSTAVEACNLLGAISDRWREDAEITQHVDAALDKLLPLLEQDSFPDRGAVYRTLGRLGAHHAISPARTQALVERFEEKVGTSSTTYDIIEALGWLASGDGMEERDRLELCHTLLSFLTAKLPAMSGQVRDRADEAVLHFGTETTAYVDMIPRLLEAFDRILAREDLAQGLWRRIVDVLSDLFGKAARYEMVWAPASVLILARVLGKAAQSERADGSLREELTELLLLKSNMVAIIQVLGAVAMSDSSPRMNLLAHEVLERLEKNLTAEESMDPQEERNALRSLARLLEREQIGSDDVMDRKSRQRILDLLYAGLKNRRASSLEVVKNLVRRDQAKGVPMDDIRRRLEKIGVRLESSAPDH